MWAGRDGVHRFQGRVSFFVGVLGADVSTDWTHLDPSTSAVFLTFLGRSCRPAMVEDVQVSPSAGDMLMDEGVVGRCRRRWQGGQNGSALVTLRHCLAHVSRPSPCGDHVVP